MGDCLPLLHHVLHPRGTRGTGPIVSAASIGGNRGGFVARYRPFSSDGQNLDAAGRHQSPEGISQSNARSQIAEEPPATVPALI
jgi:hypothetical protein